MNALAYVLTLGLAGAVSLCPDRITIVTQHDDAQWHEAARAAGAVEHVLKENLDAVRRILRRVPPPGRAAEPA